MGAIGKGGHWETFWDRRTLEHGAWVCREEENTKFASLFLWNWPGTPGKIQRKHDTGS